jgi:hypothetical protein
MINGIQHRDGYKYFRLLTFTPQTQNTNSPSTSRILQQLITIFQNVKEARGIL